MADTTRERDLEGDINGAAQSGKESHPKAESQVEGVSSHELENVDSNEVTPAASAAQDKPMSKNQRKKMLKHQKYLVEKKQRKLKKKEKQKEKKMKRELEGKEIEHELQPATKKIKTMDSGDALPIRIAIDLGFDDLMTDRDVLKLMKQVQRCYAFNRRASHPVQFYLTSFEGKSKERLDSIGCHYQRWDVHTKSDSLTEVFPKNDIVYLSSDSPNVISDVDMSKVYVIGGLVDHNHHKGYCLEQAIKQGLDHAQLPLQEFVKIMSRKVLAVNHVFEILVHYCDSKDWKDAFSQAIPQRKVIPRVRKKHGKSMAEKSEAINTEEVTSNDNVN